MTVNKTTPKIIFSPFLPSLMCKKPAKLKRFG
jgi:hypothetical protein